MEEEGDEEDDEDDGEDDEEDEEFIPNDFDETCEFVRDNTKHRFADFIKRNELKRTAASPQSVSKMVRLF